MKAKMYPRLVHSQLNPAPKKIQVGQGVTKKTKKVLQYQHK